jgi:hypothetical protein
MNAQDWIGLGGVALALVTLARSWWKDKARTERETATFMTRAEHDRICTERNERTEKQLDDIRRDIERRDATAREVQDRMHRQNVAQLNRLESTATGTHRRVDELLLLLADRKGPR